MWSQLPEVRLMMSGGYAGVGKQMKKILLRMQVEVEVRLSTSDVSATSDDICPIE